MNKKLKFLGIYPIVSAFLTETVLYMVFLRNGPLIVHILTFFLFYFGYLSGWSIIYLSGSYEKIDQEIDKLSTGKKLVIVSGGFLAVTGFVWWIITSSPLAIIITFLIGCIMSIFTALNM